MKMSSFMEKELSRIAETPGTIGDEIVRGNNPDSIIYSDGRHWRKESEWRGALLGIAGSLFALGLFLGIGMMIGWIQGGPNQ